MEKQIDQEEEIILDKQELLLQQQQNQARKNQKNNQIEIIDMKQNIEASLNKFNFYEEINWPNVRIIEEHKYYNIEEGHVNNQPQKKLSIIRIKFNDHPYRQQLFNEVHSNFNLIMENYQKFKILPIIFQVKQIEEKEIVIITQQFLNQYDFKLKFTSKDYINWLYEATLDLLQLINHGITFYVGSLQQFSIVQTRMKYFLINPVIFVPKDLQMGLNYKVDSEEINNQEQQAKLNKQTKANISNSMNGNEEIYSETIQNIITQSLFFSLSLVLQRNLFANEIINKKNKNIEKLMLKLIEESISIERSKYVNQVMDDFQKNQRWHLLELRRKKKGRRKSLSKSKNSKTKQNIYNEFSDQWEELKQNEEKRVKESFKSEYQSLYDQIISINELNYDLIQINKQLKQQFQIEKNIKKKQMISLSDERNVKKLVQLLNQNQNKSDIRDQNSQNDDNKHNKDEEELEIEEEKKLTNKKNLQKKTSNGKVKKQISKLNKKGIKKQEKQENEENKRIKLNDVKRKIKIPRKTGRLFKGSGIILNNEPDNQDEKVEIQDNNSVEEKHQINSIKFSFSIYSDSQQVNLLYKALKPYKNNLTSLTLLFTSIKLNSKILIKSIIPIFSFPNLCNLRINLNGCFQSNPIFWEEGDLDDETAQQDDISKDSLKKQKMNQMHDESKQNQQKTKNEKIQEIIQKLIERGSNPQLEFFEIHLERNYAREEDIDILFGFLKSAFKNLAELEIGWQDSYLNEKQVTQICNHLLHFKDQLTQVGLTLWKNSRIGDEQVQEICDCLAQFTNIASVTIGLLDCKVTNQIGVILKNLLDKLPFLVMLEIGLDDNNLNSALGIIGQGLKYQKQLRYLGISFQDSYINDESLNIFCDGLSHMYNLQDFHFFVGKNQLTYDSITNFFDLLSPYSKQLLTLDLGFQKSNLSSAQFTESFCQFLKNQFNLVKIELSFDNTKLKGDSIAKILDSINREQEFEVIRLNLQRCSLSSEGFLAMTRLLEEIQHPQALTHLRIYAPKNLMTLNEEEQKALGSSIGKFINLIELDLDFSGCHFFNDFFLELCESLSKLNVLESYTLILHNCFLSQLRMKCIIAGLQNKPKLTELCLEFEDSDIPTVDQYYDPNELITSFDIHMPELKQLSLNFLRCSWSFKLAIIILHQIGSQKRQLKPLPNFNSLNVYICNQQLEELMLYNFSQIVNKFYSNAAELTLTFDDCDLDFEKCSSLFLLNLQQLRNIDISLSENIDINMKSLSQFIANNQNIQYLGLKLRHLQQPVLDFGLLGNAIKRLTLKSFNLYFEQSQIQQPRQLEFFYNGLAVQNQIEYLTIHLHNIDHSTAQIKYFAKQLQQMNELVQLNLHLPNSMLRKDEISFISISLENKKYLKELILEFYKNEIIYKNGIYFARSIASLLNLQKLDFSLMKCEILPATAEKLCLSLGELKQLRQLHLYLGENQINQFTLIFLTYSLYNLKNIVNFKINLQDTSIGDEGIASLAQGLLNLDKITCLDLNLENTEIESESLVVFGRFFREKCQNLQSLELNLRNNSTITEIGFRSLMEGIGQVKSLTHIIIMFNHCLLNQLTSSHLPLFLENKKCLKYLSIYFDENTLQNATAKSLGVALKQNCLKLKRFTLCAQLNQMGNEGIINLFEGIFQVPELQKVTLDIRQNEISQKNTLVKMGAAMSKSKKLKELELFVFENQEFNDRQIAKGLYSIAQSEIDLFDQLLSFEVRNLYWRENIKDVFNPIITRLICCMQIMAFQNYLSQTLHYNSKFTIWDLYLP
ncbi:hypothetical protein TTHERM_00442990 (macronuclear) [Tetrahymena thermophila SB210]|uniref:Uncharacterized protein n=1 Tax=Tetrahymena thermophila (strain SB210) TaxID=312017 RepID=I7MGX2_TETTS|nr:hypothetical protein TTHERM_00442990 [Tetrahymena thermophila SB210]EAR85549.2 hypothetical protein TTHERM_00442990 [Tetrahymena thermophila SB210]|eukprot:XP_001033212.2 hypothetical protein TTHERM_00442990 [Tetrahymena thermophila SB210]